MTFKIIKLEKQYCEHCHKEVNPIYFNKERYGFYSYYENICEECFHKKETELKYLCELDNLDVVESYYKLAK